MAKQLSQNLKALLQEIGEASTLLQLSIRLRDHPEWRAFRNYADDGCDIVLIQTLGNRPRQQFNVEVKTRQSIVTARKHSNVMHFTLTASEYAACDYVVAYWLDRSDYFILPKNALTPISSDGKALYKFIAYVSKRTAVYNKKSTQYCNNWEPIINAIATCA